MSLYKKLRRLHDNVRRRPSRSKQARRFTIEGLENRDLLSVTVDHGSLYVELGTNGVYIDQPAYDVVNVDLNSSGGVLIQLDSQVYSYTYGEINHVYVDTEGGFNTINNVSVLNTSSIAPVTINNDGTNFDNGGTNYDDIGNSYDGVQGIKGSVDIQTADVFTNISIDDTDNSSSYRTVTVDQTGVYGLAPAAITYNHAALDTLDIDTGSEGDTFYVNNTQPWCGTAITNKSGGANAFYVYGTTGPLGLDGGDGFQSVDVGVGSLAAINGAIGVYNSDQGSGQGSGQGSSYLYIDDSLDPTGQVANLYDGELTGLGASAPIEWTPSASATGGVTYVDVDGGSGGNAFYVHNTSSLYNGTRLSTGGGGFNTVDVHATTGPLDIDGGSGFDSVDVGEGSLAGINGAVHVYNSSSGSTGSSYLTINDSSDPTGQTATLSDGELTGLGASAPIYWTPSASFSGGVTYLTVAGGSGGNKFYVDNTSNLYMDTYLSTGGGSNSVYIYATSGTLEVDGGSGFQDVFVGMGSMAAINGSVDVYNSGQGSSYLFFNDSADATGRSATLSATLSYGELTGLGASAPIYWSPSASSTGGVTLVYVSGGSGGNTFDVDNTSELYYDTYLFPGSGSNNVDVYATTGTLDLDGDSGFQFVRVGLGSLAGINGMVDVFNSSSSGSSYLYVDDSSDPTGRVANLSNGELTGLGASAPIKWTPSASATGGVTLVDVHGGSGGNAFNVVNTSNLYNWTYLSTGGGTNTVNVTATIGPLTLVGSGTDTLVGPNTTNTWNITNANAGNLGVVRFSGIANLTGGSANDTFNFGSGAGVTGIVNGGGGSNTLNDSAYTAPVTVNLQSDTATGTGGFSKIATLVGGSSTANTLIGANATHTWNITGTNAGNVAGVTFSAFPNLTGGTGMDIFKFSNGKNVTGTIKGGGGADWLDYSSYTTAVTVNLATGAATGVGTKVTNVHNVRGGQGGNTITGDAKGGILIGGAGVDTITGGSGRSILIGDKGADKVTGGSSDDIVIGGYTSYDGSSTANDQALDAILTEWQSSDSYLTRIAKITAGVSGAKFVWGTTVLDDGAANTLTGGGGMNWFFKGAHDKITDLQPGEQIN